MVRLRLMPTASNIDYLLIFGQNREGQAKKAPPALRREEFVFEDTMSLDKSLKKAGTLTRARNVLSRAERLALLQEDERWTPDAGVYNLPKTKYRRLAPGQSGPKRPEGNA
jgi:small basic protein (TIGR04137 family)